MEIHNIEPVYNADSKILLLGSFPSVKSREGQFFYHHPQNRFWKVIAALCSEPVPQSIEDKRQMLLRHHIAVWDVIYSCTIIGSSDQSIKDVVINDIQSLMDKTAITTIATNGTLATNLYRRHSKIDKKVTTIALPSTSAANARYSLEKLIETWKERLGAW